MNETHGMLLQKLDEILTKLDKLTSNQVNNQDVGSEGAMSFFARPLVFLLGTVTSSTRLS